MGYPSYHQLVLRFNPICISGCSLFIYRVGLARLNVKFNITLKEIFGWSMKDIPHSWLKKRQNLIEFEKENRTIVVCGV